MPRPYRSPDPPDFRTEAVRLVRDGGRSISHEAKQADLDNGACTDGLTAEERHELVQLRRENRVLREGHEIQKAVAFFATETSSSWRFARPAAPPGSAAVCVVPIAVAA